MGKIKSSLGKKEILLFAVKCIVLNAAFICDFSALSASMPTSALCAFLTAFLCGLKFKNNGFIIGCVTYIPLFIFSLANLISGKSSLTAFLIKLAACVLLSGIGGLYSVKRAKRVRLKK